MTDKDEIRSDFEKLNESPSTELWAIELNRVFRGDRDAELEYIGDASEYVYDTISHSADPARSQQFFLRAFDKFLRIWTPDPHESPLMHSRVFDLLQKYTLPAGFLKVAKLLELHTVLDRKVPDNPGIDLRLRALHALENYFPAPPVPNHPVDSRDPVRLAYIRYVQILHGHLESPKYVAYSLRALIKLNEFDITAPKLKAIVSAAPSVLSGIVDLACDKSRRARAGDELKTYYQCCLDLGEATQKIFRAIIDVQHGQVNLLREGPSISLPGQDPIQLHIDEKHYRAYFRVQMDDANSRAEEAIDDAVMKAGAG